MPTGDGDREDSSEDAPDMSFALFSIRPNLSTDPLLLLRALLRLSSSSPTARSCCDGLLSSN